MKNYELKFYNAKNLTAEQLEDNYSGGFEIPDINKAKMDNIIRGLKSKGIKFEVLEEDEDEDEYYIDLSFKNYDVQVLDDLIGIIIPKEKNKKLSDKVINEIQLVINVLIDNDMTGYDRQLKTLFGYEYNLGTALNGSSSQNAPISADSTGRNNGPVIIEENPKSNPLRLIIILVLLFAVIYAVVYFVQHK